MRLFFGPPHTFHHITYHQPPPPLIPSDGMGLRSAFFFVASLRFTHPLNRKEVNSEAPLLTPSLTLPPTNEKPVPLPCAIPAKQTISVLLYSPTPPSLGSKIEPPRPLDPSVHGCVRAKEISPPRGQTRAEYAVNGIDVPTVPIPNSSANPNWNLDSLAPPAQEVQPVAPLAKSPPRKHHPSAKSHPHPQSPLKGKGATDRAYPQSPRPAKKNPPQRAGWAQRIEETFPGYFRADHSTPPTKRTVKSRSEITEARRNVQVGGYPGRPTVSA